MKNKKLCIELLELILKRKIKDIMFMTEQKPIEITADGTADDISEEMKDFLDYLKGKGTKSDFARRINEEVVKARTHAEWRVEYMSLILRDHEKREEGREEARRAMVMNMLKKNMEVDMICEVAECDEAYIETARKDLDKNDK